MEINQKALLYNLEQFKKLIGPRVKLMSVVKANAYGHGLLETAKIIGPKTDWFGVDSLKEALILRQMGVRKPILTLGYVELGDLKEAVKNRINLTVYNKETIAKLISIPIKNPLFYPKVHIKIETGTSRQGVGENEIREFIQYIKKYPSIKIEGVSTHFANIEDTTDSNYAQKQLAVFNKVILEMEREGVTPSLKHTACSAAAILFPETRFDMVRLGISLYGLWPSKETRAVAQNKNIKLNLKPALTWKTIVAQIKKIKSGTPVGYGLTEAVSRDSTIAVIPVGYFDGFDRKLSSVGNVLIGGKRCKVLGRICMNMFIVDVTDLPKIKIEDEVVLLGEQGREKITAEEMAQKIGTVNYELITRINPFIARVIK